jgi:hypothetical protein
MPSMLTFRELGTLGTASTFAFTQHVQLVFVSR